MSEKNLDVVRALAAFGCNPIEYHSFGPFVVRPRVTYVAAEAEQAMMARFATRAAEPVAPARMASESFEFDHEAFDVPATAPLPPPVRVEERRPAMATQAPEPVVVVAPMPVPPPAPAPAAPPRAVPAAEPAPLYPLLAASLPGSAVPMAPRPQPAPPPPSAGAMMPGSAWLGMNALRSPAPTPAPEPPAPAVTAFPSADPQVEQRSLNEMFRMLSGRAEAAPPPPPPPEPPAAAPGGALFRRI